MCRNIGRWSALVMALAGVFLVGLEGLGQEGTGSPSLEQQLAEWAKLEAQFDALEAKIQADGPDVEAARAEYQQLVAAANAAVASIESAAMAELESDRSSSRAIRALLGIMMNEARRGQDAKVLSTGDFLIGKGINPKYFEIAAKSEQLKISQKELFDELLLRHAEAMANDLPRVRLSTNRGDIVLELFENEASGTVGNFIQLVEQGYYDGLLFHRVVEGFVAQGGGYRLNSAGEQDEQTPGYEIKCECYSPEARLHFSGSLSMAKRIPRDTGGSQFFLTLERTSFLDGRHTVFGRVIEGGDVLDRLVRTHLSSEASGTGQEEPIEEAKPDQIVKAVVIRKRDHEYAPDKSTQDPNAASGAATGDGQ